MKSWALRCDRVCKSFRLGDVQDSLRDALTHWFHRLFGSARAPGSSRSFQAIQDVTLEAAQGEAVGIIGPNGAGKSTLLRLLAGILRPDHGTIAVCGRTAALIELGAGFHGDLTGRDNIALNGAILAMKRREIREKLEAIVDFAGIGPFLDQPVKRYSSGMYARLGFSIAAHCDPEVLLVDEVLSVGDAVFRLRCLERMRELVRAGTALVFVTHSLEQLQTICPRTMVLDRGSTTFDGPTTEAVGRYLAAVSRSFAMRATDVTAHRIGQAPRIQLEKLELLNGEGTEVGWITPDRPVTVRAIFSADGAIPNAVLEMNLRSATGELILSFNSGRDERSLSFGTGRQQVALSLPSIPLAGGHYFWNVRVWDAESGVTELDTAMAFPLVVNDGGRPTGKLTLDHAWTFEDHSSNAHPASQTNSAGHTRDSRPHEHLLLR